MASGNAPGAHHQLLPSCTAPLAGPRPPHLLGHGRVAAAGAQGKMQGGGCLLRQRNWEAMHSAGSKHNAARALQQARADAQTPQVQTQRSLCAPRLAPVVLVDRNAHLLLQGQAEECALRCHRCIKQLLRHAMVSNCRRGAGVEGRSGGQGGASKAGQQFGGGRGFSARFIGQRKLPPGGCGQTIKEAVLGARFVQDVRRLLLRRRQGNHLKWRGAAAGSGGGGGGGSERVLAGPGAAVDTAGPIRCKQWLQAGGLEQG